MKEYQLRSTKPRKPWEFVALTTQQHLPAKVGTTPTSGGRSVGIVPLRTKATEFSLFFIMTIIIYIALIRSTLCYGSIAWNCLTSADSNKLEDIKRTFSTLSYDVVIQFSCPCNNESLLNYEHSRTLYSTRHLLNVLRIKLTVVLFWLMWFSVYALNNLGTFLFVI
jgi:hypothetical protein